MTRPMIPLDVRCPKCNAAAGEHCTAAPKAANGAEICGARSIFAYGPALGQHVYLPAYENGERPLVIKEIRNGIVDIRPPRARHGRHWLRNDDAFTDYDAERGGWRLTK